MATPRPHVACGTYLHVGSSYHHPFYPILLHFRYIIILAHELNAHQRYHIESNGANLGTVLVEAHSLPTTPKYN